MLAKSIFLATTVSAAVLLAGPTAVACAVKASPVATTPVVYDPFALAPVQGQAELSLELTDAKACDVMLDLQDVHHAPLTNLAIGGPQPALFAIRNPDADDPAHVVIHLSPDQPRETIRWDFVPARDAVLAAGHYVTTIAVGIRPETEASDNFEYGTFTVTVPARAQVNIAGSSGGFGSSHVSVVDFGPLRTGAQRRVFVQVRANGSVVAEITSKNHGLLRNETWPNADPIRYGLTLDGSSVDLSQSANLPLNPPPTIDGLSLPMDLTVGSTEGKMAGRYSDTITIEVSPR